MLTSSGRALVVAAAVLGVFAPFHVGHAGTSNLAFLQPWFEVRDKDAERLTTGGVIVRGLPARDRYVRVITACAIAITPDAFVSRFRAAGDVKRPDWVERRFGDPPALEDLAALSLDEGDLERLRACRPGDCRLNLAAHEMGAMQRALAPTARGRTRDAQEVFRRVVLDRAAQYRGRGLLALPEYHDRSRPVHPAAIFSDILQQTPYLTTHLPDIAAYLERFPFSDTAVESSLLWSKVMMNRKPVVMVTHLGIFRPRPGPNVPAVLIARKQVYASRYMNGELTLMMLFAGPADSPNYLVNVNLSELDELGGAFGGLKAALIERAIKKEAVDTVAALRDRLEHAP